ncbi:hypothetical protein [Curtobacterium oceanosedimentum]|uniref:Uncharacterized protein n=1 Tax=Curtobacterium oceanosedimentum TaxID=465820 RepID=A0A147DPZ4_9MICO|nr:hypothetical protein [Curtobacterium oceanosedimentum]KTR51328.1 hypothetical protein NS359_10750 [Curtobacterium oceanosedimentum]
MAGLLALAVVVSGLGAAWLVTGDDDGDRAGRPSDRPTVAGTAERDDGAGRAGETVPTEGSVPADASGPIDRSGPLAVSNALGVPIPGAGVRQGVPRSVEDWVDRVLPVAGTATPLVDGFAATIRIERADESDESDESTVTARVDGLSLPPGTQSVRLVLAPDALPDVEALAHAASIVSVPIDGSTSGGFALVIGASALQADTRSAALVDDETDAVLGVALLVPAD